MQYLVKSGNAYGVLRIELAANEFIFARHHALFAFSDHIAFTQSKAGGFFRRLARKFSGAHLAMQQIRAGEQNGWVMLAPPMIGAISGIELHGKSILVEEDAFLAAGQAIATNGRLYTMDKTKFVMDDFQAIKFNGDGLVFLNAFGAIEAVTLLPEQTIQIHPGHLIAWEEQLAVNEADRGFISLTGPGRLWVQTRQAHGFSEWQHGLKEAHKSANS